MSKYLKQIFLIVMSIVIIVIGVVYYFTGNHNARRTPTLYTEQGINISNPTESSPTESLEIKNETVNKSSFRVYISGAVVNPDVYDASPEIRVVDLIELAGGSTSEADLEKINLAAYVSDAKHIYVPRKGENVSQASTDEDLNENKDENGKININTSSIAGLTKLPGIGAALAQSIVQYRENNNKFKSIEEIKEVSGIGEKRFEQIKDLITIE